MHCIYILMLLLKPRVNVQGPIKLFHPNRQTFYLFLNTTMLNRHRWLVDYCENDAGLDTRRIFTSYRGWQQATSHTHSMDSDRDFH